MNLAVFFVDGTISAGSYDGCGQIWGEDPATLDPRLNSIAQGGIILKRGKVKSPVNFTLYSNYIAFIDRWELSVYANNDRDLIKPIATLSGDKFAFTDTVEWQAQLVDEKYFEEGESASRGRLGRPVWHTYSIGF